MAKYYYNGVLLPEIPADLLAEYPYAWIRKDEANGRYNLMVAATPWYYVLNPSGAPTISKGTGFYAPYYGVDFEGYESAESWVHISDEFLDFALASNRTVLWSNHDMPNGSADATEIYFYGSEPVDAGNTPPKITYYRISSTRLKAIADQVRRITGTEDDLTLSQMVTALMGIATGSAEG